MKFRLLTIAFGIVAGINCYAQSDTLLIKLKNGTVEQIPISQIKKVQFENASNGVGKNDLSNSLQLKGNYPNPFNEQTNIEFEIENAGEVEIRIYNNEGEQVQTLNCTDCQTGKNYLHWNALDSKGLKVPNGVYYYEVRYGKEVSSKKMIVIN